MPSLADLYCRFEQAHSACKYLQSLVPPIERRAIQPEAMASECENVQAMQQFVGQGRRRDEALLSGL